MKTSGQDGIPLASKILLSSSALLIILIFAMLVSVNFQAHRFVTNRVTEDLVQGGARINAAIEDQLSALSLTARLVASIPMLEAVVTETDLPTIRDFLRSYQGQNHAPDLLIVLDSHGRVLARTDTPQTDPVPDVQSRWVGPALSGERAVGTLSTRGAVYNVAVAPSEAEGVVFGFILAGSRIDHGFARKLSGVSHDEVVMLGDHVIDSSIPVSELPWRSRADWETRGRQSGVGAVRVGNEAYSVVPVRVAYPGAPLILALQSNTKELAPYRRIQAGLLLLGFLATAIGVAGSAIFARRLTAPIRELVRGTREVAAGNFNFRLNVDRNDEIGVLAESFNNMTRGLRERSDMQKFVSNSTLKMIQSAGAAALAGERKVLTIFFSDIRGFTSLSEHRDPAHVVSILNRIFTLQAEHVQQFSGDIDKYVGDAIVALFQGENAPSNAIRCAQEIHRALRIYNVQRPPDEPPIEIGIGISTGEVILGSIGSEDRRDFTAIGCHVNLCARLCGLARPGEILVAEDTYQEVRNVISAERLQPQSVKGFSTPVPVYRITV